MDFLSAALLLFFIIDPVGNIPIFGVVLRTVPAERRLRVIAREMLIAYAVLLLFLLTGDWVLAFLGIDRSTLSISGGIILFLVALNMVFPGQILLDEEDQRDEPFIVPLAIPMIAGPSAIALVLLLAEREPARLTLWVGALTLAWGLSALILLASGPILRILGNHGLRAVERLIGLLLIMLAVQMFMDGIRDYLQAAGVN